ncbi:MAG: coproporphyrinogen III oxidase, partial [Hyphomicrobiales bacterium]|nr:coproporphyrinogen III oxidase [Hyphomicrobiales bacterium]
NVADVECTAAQAASLHPGRIAVFGYAHVPWFKKHQAVFETQDLPDTAERFDQACIAAETLKGNFYTEIGFDHYARHTDALARAADEGKLRRNFQGYTDDSTDILLGLGASSIGTLHGGHVQNAPGLGNYRELVRQGRLPVVRGVELQNEDVLRGAAIGHILCNLELDAAAVCRSHSAAENTLDDALHALRPMQADGLVEIADRQIRVLPQGRRLLRNVAACFDAYRATAESRHSPAV